MSQHANAETILEVRIEGMTCRSCELLVERKWNGLDEVSRVDADAAAGSARLTLRGAVPSAARLQAALGSDQYRVLDAGETKEIFPTKRPSFGRLFVLFVLVWLLGTLLSNIGIFRPSTSFASGTSLWAVFAVGLVAASSSCIAVAGGLLMSSAAAFNARYAPATGVGRMQPTVFFVVGRVLSYGLFGGLIGLVGRGLTPSPLVTGLLTIVAALYMFIMGLDMLHLAPSWAKRVLPRLSKRVSHRVLDAGRKDHWAAPLLLGGATFVLPCGFTQALQLYALTTGSFGRGAEVLGVFALGTAPALLALGWASSSLKGRAGRLFLQVSGAAVILLALWNVQNGLAIVGRPLTWPSFGIARAEPTGPMSSVGGASFDGRIQTIDMTVGRDGYLPSRFTIRPGVPTRWQIDGTNASGCATVLQSPALGVAAHLLSAGENVLEFTAPTQPGVYPFSCSMGMYRGQIIVSSNS